MLEIVKQFNWVDILITIVFIRICYAALKAGFPVEIFKFCGTLLAIYLAMHYYTLLSDFFSGRLGVKFIPVEFLDFLSFIILALIGYFVFMILRQAFGRLIKVEAVALFSKWGGLVLGVARAFLFTSLLVFIFVISSTAYLKNSAEGSYLSKRLFYVAPNIYRAIWNGVMSKFMTGEKFNPTIPEVQENLKSK